MSSSQFIGVMEERDTTNVSDEGHENDEGRDYADQDALNFSVVWNDSGLPVDDQCGLDVISCSGFL
jgi:hypothetical protein